MVRRKAVVEVVNYNGSPNVFAWRFPKNTLGTWTQLIVNESQEAVLFKDYKAYDIFGPGRYTLSTTNIPILNRLINLPYGDRTPFTAEIWFINKQHSLDIKWGTPTPIQLKDQKFNIMIPVRSFGQFGITVEDSKIFINKLVGTLPTFTSQDMINFFRGLYLTKVRTVISQYISKKEISVLEINTHLLELSDKLKESINSRLRNEYGIRLLNFFVNDISIPNDDPSVMQLKAALAKSAEMDNKNFEYSHERSFNILNNKASQEQPRGMIGEDIGVSMSHGKAEICESIQTKQTKECQVCHYTMEKAFRFCGSCGHDTQATFQATPELQSATITCECGYSYSKEYKFCGKCGNKAPVPFACISCRKTINECAKFCHHCGAAQVSSAYKECSNCATKVDIKARFCSDCGTSFE